MIPLKASPKTLFFCMGKNCKKKNKGLLKWAKKHNAFKDYQCIKMSCSNNCGNKPVMFDAKEHLWVGKVTKENIKMTLKKNKDE
ncbi:hypothetical protein [Persicobacter sp. CCB-QB2]|uniref:hypothetical protein n=1 Tax=Persicobacter sp. CCB-QB2 TaxID=1561025 RepID=UPI0012FCDEE4|nr:hypothetical protein [Persicobacter sp. CCB-QB2]